ncbi:CDP-diacylglycerol-inositol 3-phosphatidyltransferase [Saitozyma podzolica]|uniref:CDP-diacylglycerol-inositol 3-phosphatidyltransferase n=1 Tax=Saitozyma podzolica TaxID=1890683 RepID=A0A427YUP2_9TREE|nr:CDP-diacylglycerol-inositol 3-phosphatidyltransferase [Saitozyma podzolica]
MAPTTRSKQATPTPKPLAWPQACPPAGLHRAGRDKASAVDLATTTVDENVFLFVPNLIGYSRVILAAISLFFMPIHPKFCTVLYTISCLLDAVDGQAARALGQASKFGAVLDMVTDRCTTACLMCFLAAEYSQWALLFMFLITLDFSSHYIHMYSTLVTGSTSHKAVTSDVSRILWLYYNDSRTLFFFCFANECFFVCLYLNRWWTSPIAPNFPFPDAFLNSELALTHKTIFTTIIYVARHATWPQVVAVLSFVPCAIKQIINVVQFWKASKILVGVDLAERQAAREAAARKSRQ